MLVNIHCLLMDVDLSFLDQPLTIERIHSIVPVKIGKYDINLVTYHQQVTPSSMDDAQLIMNVPF